jgi:hypothetical protein
METAWLVEMHGTDPSGPLLAYYCGPQDWCLNANHAKKFATKGDTDAIINELNAQAVGNVYLAVDHAWVG